MSSAAKRSSALGSVDQFDMDQSAEVELQKLQRQVYHLTSAFSSSVIYTALLVGNEQVVKRMLCYGSPPMQLAMIIMIIWPVTSAGLDNN